MTTEQFKQLCEERLADINTAIRITGYAHAQGFEHAIKLGVMPEPILRFPRMKFWDVEELIRARKGRAVA